MNNSDRDIKAWEQRLKEQTMRGWENYTRKRIDLSSARTVEYWGIPGEFLYIEQASSKSALASVRLNRNTNDEIDLALGTVVKTIFTTLYITNTAQAGQWIDIIIGINFEYYKKYQGDLGSLAKAVVPLTHANPNTNIAAGAQVSNAVLIKADTNNTADAWIDFGTPAVQNACLPLSPGDNVSVHLNNLNQVNANFEVGGEYVFIIYEV